ncbi:hypothetical protein IJT17_09600 [bacterium]|nr:hypothetical protein [bacterium]
MKSRIMKMLAVPAIALGVCLLGCADGKCDNDGCPQPGNMEQADVLDEGSEAPDVREYKEDGLRHISVYIPEAKVLSRSNFGNRVEVRKRWFMIAALDSNGQPLAGSVLGREEPSTLPKTDGKDLGLEEPHIIVRAGVPAQTDRFLLLWNVSTKGYPPTQYVFPLAMGHLSADKDICVIAPDDMFSPDQLTDGEFGPYSDEKCSEWSASFGVGEQVYFFPVIRNAHGDEIKVSGIVSMHREMLDDDLKAINPGASLLHGSWYGVEGVIMPYPIRVRRDDRPVE